MSAIRVIGLPNGRRVTLGTYAKAWRKLLTVPADSSIEGWSHFTTPARDILRAMRDGLADRINQRDPRYGKGRKWGEEWFFQVRRLASSVNSRVRVYPCDVPRELRARLAHRIATE